MLQEECYTLMTAISLIQRGLGGHYDGRPFLPGLVIPTYVDKVDQRPVRYGPWAEQTRWLFNLPGGVDPDCHDVST